MNRKIALASDHAGYEIKEVVKKSLIDSGYLVEDFGAHSTESIDYPDTAHPAVQAVVSQQCDTGILVCGTGQGMQLVANKYPGIRAALCVNPEFASLARRHNDANVLTIPGRFVTPEEAREIVKVWLETSFEGGRHRRRVEKIHEAPNN